MKISKSICKLSLLLLLINLTAVYAQESQKLPNPRIRGQVMKALKNRISVKGFNPEKLPDKVLSDVVWAAFGVSNPNTGKRTAPSAFNAQEIDIYALTADGAFRYDAAGHALQVITTQDIREYAAGQNYAKSAPLHLVFVADYDRARAVYPESYDREMKSWAMLHTGLIGQNVILYCSSHDMTAVVRSVNNREALRRELKLGEHQEITITQAVGYLPNFGIIIKFLFLNMDAIKSLLTSF